MFNLRKDSRINSEPTAPLFILIHGRAGNIESMRFFANLIDVKLNYLLIEAPTKDPIGGFSWWLTDTAPNSPINEQSVTNEVLLELGENFVWDLDFWLAAKALTPKEVYIVGFSQGAGFASCLIRIYPKLFKRAALLSGFVPKLDNFTINNPDQHFKTDVLMIHGEDDPVVNINIARTGSERLKELGFNVEFLPNEATHKVGKLGLKRLKEWFQEPLQQTSIN
jgi:phospholipase/carboxylesterase